MKTFFEIQLTICKTTKKFVSETISWYYECKSNANKKYNELNECCRNYENFCKDWKYLHVQLIERKFDD